MEAYCIEAESVQQQCETGKCILENMGEDKEQVKDSSSRITRLVSISKKPFTISAIGVSYALANIPQVEGQRCNLVIWAATAWIGQVIKNTFLLAS